MLERIPIRGKLFLLLAAIMMAVGSGGNAIAAPADKTPGAKKTTVRETATLAAGCFWSMEAIYKQLKGVDKVEPGYAGGKSARPTYEQIETGTTGYAEALNITFDPNIISYHDLLEVLLTARNPTSLNKQGNDEGPQYRSVIFYRSEAQRKTAEETIQQITHAHVWPHPIVTPVTPFTNFYKAEDYHFDYYRLHPNEPYCRYVIAPEIAEFRAKFKSKLKR